MSRFVTAKEARKILGISSATLMRWRESGKIPSMHVSKKKILYDVDNVYNKEEADSELTFARNLAAASGKSYDDVYEWLKPIADVTPCRNLSYIAADGKERMRRISNPQYEKGQVPATETTCWNPGNAKMVAVSNIIKKVYEQCAGDASHTYKIGVASAAAVGEQVMKFMEDDPYHMPPTAIICSKSLAEKLGGPRSEVWISRTQSSLQNMTYMTRYTAKILVDGSGAPTYAAIPAYIWDDPAAEDDDWHATHFVIVRSKPHESGVKLVMGLNPIKSVKMQEVPIDVCDLSATIEIGSKRTDSFSTYGKTVSVSIDVNASVQTVGESQCTLVEYKSTGKTDEEIFDFVLKKLDEEQVVGMEKDGSISVRIPQFEVQYEDLFRLCDDLERVVQIRMPGYSHVQLIPYEGSTTVKVMLMTVGGVGDNPADFRIIR